MAPKRRAVTAKALQSLLVRIGAASSGTKASLEERFRHDITRTRLFPQRPKGEISRPTNEKFRIMSIDMGIKNLAFCEAEVSYPAKDSLNATMDVLRWERVDLAPATRNVAQLDRTGVSDEAADEEVDAYSHDALSRTAYGLVRETILSGAPDVVLIEKQRWRSGGGSAVQQWTLRVNTLEGMLWAVLKTLYNERLLTLEKETDADKKKKAGLYDVFGVDPKRVGQYWLGQNAQRLAGEAEAPPSAADAPDETDPRDTTSPKLSRSKAEKKAKISLLRSWLTALPASTTPTTGKTTPAISFTIGKNAESTYQALCFPSKSARSTKKKGVGEESRDGGLDDIPAVQMRKLDDVTDCFLQAAAWVSWESNRAQLRDVWRSKRSKGRKGRIEQSDTHTPHDYALPDLDDTVLQAMLSELEA